MAHFLIFAFNYYFVDFAIVSVRKNCSMEQVDFIVGASKHAQSGSIVTLDPLILKMILIVLKNRRNILEENFIFV